MCVCVCVCMCVCVCVCVCVIHVLEWVSFRMVGTLPAIFIMEALVDYVAKSLGLDVEQVKRANLYQLGQV